MKVAPQVQLAQLVEKVTSWNPIKAGSEDKFQYIDLSAVDQDLKKVTGARELACSDAPSRARQLVAQNDVLVSTVRPNLNAVAVVTPAQHGATASTGFCVVRAAKNKLDPQYLFQWVKTEHFVSEMVRQATGASYPAVSDKIILNSTIPLPPLPEQRRIAAILDQADTLRAKRREALAELDKLAQSIFVEMFGDPATNPKGWPMKRLDSICEVGSSKRVFVEELTGDGIPFYRGTEIGKFGEGAKAEPTLFISEEHYARLKAEAGVPRKGDLLMPSICPDGRIYVVDTDEPFYFKDARVLWIKVEQKLISSLYLRHHLKLVFSKDYSKIASGTTFAELKIFALKQLAIASPPIELQRRFEKVVMSVDAQLETSKQSQQTLSELFDSLQHRAFRGEL